jgi:hypothetical protein
MKKSKPIWSIGRVDMMFLLFHHFPNDPNRLYWGNRLNLNEINLDFN